MPFEIGAVSVNPVNGAIISKTGIAGTVWDCWTAATGFPGGAPVDHKKEFPKFCEALATVLVESIATELEAHVVIPADAFGPGVPAAPVNLPIVFSPLP